VVQVNTTGGTGAKPTDSQLLELYGLYKVATCGPCNEPQPGLFNMKARSKWGAWKDKSKLSVTDAMDQYARKVMDTFNWTPPSDEEIASCSIIKSHSSGFAPAVSRPHVPKDVKSKNTPFDWIKDNEISKLKKWVANVDADLNLSDEDGLSLLHLAADRGRKEICEILLTAGANPACKDDEELTPLDYAITCDHQDIIKLLETHQIAVTTPT